MALQLNLKPLFKAAPIILCLLMLLISHFAWGLTQGKATLSSFGAIRSDTPTSATLKFKTGFETNVYVTHDGSAQASLHSTDSSGFDWDDLNSFINYVESGSYPTWVDSEISTTRSHSGTQSFHQRCGPRYALGSSSLMRTQLVIICNDGGSSSLGPMQSMRKIYTSLWMYLPASFATNVVQYNVLFSYREADAFSNLIFLYPTGTGGVYWYVEGRAYAEGNRNYYSASNRAVPVPLDRWFHLEVYLERDSSSSGVLRVWVDGVKAFDFTNVKTAEGTTSQFYLMCAKILGHQTQWQDLWVDDLEIWDGMPW